MPAASTRKFLFNYSMLNANGVGGGSSFEMVPSETVKFLDIQTLCFWLIKNPTSIPTKQLPAKADGFELRTESPESFGLGSKCCRNAD